LICEFDDFVLDSARRELRKAGDLIAVEPQVFDLLEYLIAQRERVVSNDDLIEAVWGGRIVSETTVATRINAVRRAIGDNGERQKFIRTVPRKGYRFVAEVQDRNAQNSERVSLVVQAPELPDRPSISVLPFANVSGDPEQEYFADGITEDLITALSQFRWLFVIARNSSFAFKGKSVDSKQIARDLGVRYLLEGSVRKAGNRLRISGQLVDASTGTHLWADRFDGALEDVFDLQDKVTASVVGAIGPKLQQAEIERAKRKPTASLDAYDYYLRGLAQLHHSDKESTDQALRLFYRAVEYDSDFASGYGMAAWCYVIKKVNGWTSDYAQDVTEATRLARRATELGRDDAVALCWGGFTLAYVAGDLDTGTALVGQALELNRNLAAAWDCSGWVRIFLGEHELAIEHFRQALRLSPRDPGLWHTQAGMAYAHLLAGHNDEASSLVQEALLHRPTFVGAVRILAASKALGGRAEEAKKAIERLLELDPTMRISNLKDRISHLRPHDFARYADGLRKAGVPE
jgi:TolB-like protein/Flp pilus assembly protein TadD